MAENSKPLKRVNSSEFSASGKLEDRETRGGKLEAGNSTITHLGLAPIAECKQICFGKITFATHACIQLIDIRIVQFDIFPNHICLHLEVGASQGIETLVVCWIFYGHRCSTS